MEKELKREVTLRLSIGQTLLLWDILSNKVESLGDNMNFSEAQKRAIWSLEDLCENTLVENKISAMSAEELNSLIQSAEEHMNSIPVEFRD